MTREILPERRAAETFEFSFADTIFAATLGFQPDVRVGELFLNALKRDSLFDHMARDSAILISLALQHGARIEDLRKAMTRDGDGRPQGIAGFALDLMEGAGK